MRRISLQPHCFVTDDSVARTYTELSRDPDVLEKSLLTFKNTTITAEQLHINLNFRNTNQI